jgi:hypothetical protein
MGRTIPSFRLASVDEQKEWKQFRRGLGKENRKIFDNMFLIGLLYNSAASYSAKPTRIQPILMSIIFHHYKQLLGVKEELESKESEDK